MIYQAISSGFFFRTTYKIQQSTWKTTFSLLLHQLQTELGPLWYHGTSNSFQRHQTITSGPESGCHLALLVHKEVQLGCSLPTASACLYSKLTECIWGQIGLSEERKKLKESTEFPQHSCDALALVKRHVMWRTPNIFCLI